MTESDPKLVNAKPNDMNPLLGLAFVIAIAATFSWLVLSVTNQGQRNMLPLGTPAPVIKAQGWVNGEAPTEDQLKGKVILIEAWATWCLPCRMHAPELVKDYDRYKDNPAVKFIGLTSDDHSAIRQIEAFLKDTKITWLNGYGASETLSALKAEYIPTEWVIDKQGLIVWRTGDSGSITDAIDKALAKN